MQVRNIFVSSTDPTKVGVIVSEKGKIKNRPNGDRYIELDYGRRYEGIVGQPDYKIMSFEQYGVKIKEGAVLQENLTAKTTSTWQLLKDWRHPSAQGELLWRIGLPLLAFNLVLLAIPLAYQNTRQPRSLNLVIAVLFYLIYTNCLSLSQTWVAQQQLHWQIGLWLVHAVVLLMAIGLYIFRLRLNFLPRFNLRGHLSRFKK